jgi:hypothetical protein
MQVQNPNLNMHAQIPDLGDLIVDPVVNLMIWDGMIWVPMIGQKNLMEGQEDATIDHPIYVHVLDRNRHDLNQKNLVLKDLVLKNPVPKNLVPKDPVPENLILDPKDPVLNLKDLVPNLKIIDQAGHISRNKIKKN